MIEVESLTRVYGSLTAVADVSFSIRKGEVVGLLGHNGAGKSTIMKMMTGFLDPTAGTVRVDGLDIQTLRRTVQGSIGYLPENCPVWPDMTVIDFLCYQAEAHGIALDKRDAAVARAIRRTALQAKAADRIETLSRGYRQRVGVAQAILHAPEIIILDEPTNGLDPTQVREMRGLIRDLAKTSTIILSTHVLQEVRAVCERVLIMRGGRLVLDDRLDAIEQANGLRLVTDRDIGALLRSVPGVRQVQSDPLPVNPSTTPAGQHAAQTSARHVFLVDAAETAAPALARAVCDSGAALFMLEPMRRDLETVFTALTEEATHAA